MINKINWDIGNQSIVTSPFHGIDVSAWNSSQNLEVNENCITIYLYCLWLKG